VYSTGRILPSYENKKVPLRRSPTIGSIGFAVGTKGFQRLVSAVQDEFDEALIRINIPANGIIDQEAASAPPAGADLLPGAAATSRASSSRVTHDFLDDAQLIDFLASNSLNAFLYDYIPRGGISSSPRSTRWWLGAPWAISRSVMFPAPARFEAPRSPSRTPASKEIIQNGIAPYQHLARGVEPGEHQETL